VKADHWRGNDSKLDPGCVSNEKNFAAFNMLISVTDLRITPFHNSEHWNFKDFADAR
jgi:hypothetical protein